MINLHNIYKASPNESQRSYKIADSNEQLFSPYGNTRSYHWVKVTIFDIQVVYNKIREKWIPSQRNGIFMPRNFKSSVNDFENEFIYSWLTLS